MCGINGIIGNTQASSQDLAKLIHKMNSLIYHRGPDDDGFYHDNNVYMAMRRLSIIDLSTGKQPISNDDNSITIVFNGEIYNYKTLRSKLESEGVHFTTKSDTEVILRLYEKYGTSSFKMLDGMYAFSIHDTKLNKVYIARDFFGEKPLYYTQTGNNFLWASELKSIVSVLPTKPNLSKQGLNLYFKLTYIPAPFSIYQDIFKLEANHFIEYDVTNKSYQINKINHLVNNHSDLSFNEAKLKLHDLLMKSIESRSVSDVPLGTFLSGGVDSSIISLGLSKLIDSKIDTFSIGFEKASFDETDKSRLVAKLINSNHHEFVLKESDIISDIDSVLLNFDEPFADSSALPTYLVSKLTRQYVKVALTGDGGDEVFGGYNKYYMGKLNTQYTQYVPKFLHHSFKPVLKKLLSTKDDNRGKRFKLKKFVDAVDYSGNNYWNIISLGFQNTAMLLSSDYSSTNLFSQYSKEIANPKNIHDFREVDRRMSLEGDMLVKVDRTSMLNSLECRSPFLNKSLWEFSNGLPENFLINKWEKKHILKEAFKHEFPDDFLNKSKKGFVVPVGDWLRQGLKDELKSYVEDNILDKQNIFNKNYIKNLVNDHISGKRDSSYQIWTFYTFQKWYLNIYSKL
ncbi:asparagine synthase (glutamine-hydrolyzing) [Hanstruepera neustonica]|uniref:asparagine synthase (glutamine-hydrolyzing) n=1 Tax=Hanstruepera neustonica TaxID=1445657 RepID=A0A2K1DYC3_9FLAO|nr:asparagine synthase (glutamine-hydrolyzing) [Hanstruepera neustonica]PNQ73027.1 asparagine synthase (glutamine-hydrolyzing) [Hanstruepera neustonica]